MSVSWHPTDCVGCGTSHPPRGSSHRNMGPGLQPSVHLLLCTQLL